MDGGYYSNAYGGEISRDLWRSSPSNSRVDIGRPPLDVYSRGSGGYGADFPPAGDLAQNSAHVYR